MRRIITSKDFLGGIPIFEGTRTPVEMIWACYADGYSVEQILEEFPRLTREDVLFGLRYMGVEL